MRVHAHIPIGEIAAELPHVTKLLDVLGVDYVLHGHLSLRDACAEAGVDPATVRQAIDSLPREEAERPAWTDATVQELLDELIRRRHPKLELMVQDTAALLEAVPAGTHGLSAVHERLAELRTAIHEHIEKEERSIFPLIHQLETHWERGERVMTASVEERLAESELEHEELMRLLHEVCFAVAALPRDASVDPLLASLVALEHELREEMHIENNVLYPRAEALEAAAGT